MNIKYSGGGEVKEVARRVLLGETLRHFSSDIKYLGLPGITLGFEKKLVDVGDLISVEMEGWEWEGKVAKVIEMKAKQEELPIKMNKGNIHDAAGEYNLAWFDYCGCLDSDKLWGLQDFIRNHMYFNGSDDPIIAVTLLRGRESKAVWDLVPGQDEHDWDWLRRKFLADTLNVTAAEQDMHFEVIRYLEYMETSPMLLMVGRIGKGTKVLDPFTIERHLKHVDTVPPRRGQRGDFDWSQIDWTKSGMQIARDMGCSPQSVYYQRNKRRMQNDSKRAGNSATG